MYYFLMLSAIVLLWIKLRGKSVFQYSKYDPYFEFFQNKQVLVKLTWVIKKKTFKKVKSIIVSMADRCEISYKSRVFCKNSACPGMAAVTVTAGSWRCDIPNSFSMSSGLVWTSPGPVLGPSGVSLAAFYFPKHLLD